MMKRSVTFGALLVMSCAWAQSASAQVVLVARTFVSSAGSDANACSRTAPCLTFSGAASKTAARGEITALDSGTFGNITITKALTLQAAPGVQAMLGSLSSKTPVVVDAGESDVVVLRNLHISRAGPGTATRGIEFNSGGALHIEPVSSPAFPIPVFTPPLTDSTRTAKALSCSLRAPSHAITARASCSVMYSPRLTAAEPRTTSLRASGLSFIHL